MTIIYIEKFLRRRGFTKFKSFHFGNRNFKNFQVTSPQIGTRSAHTPGYLPLSMAQNTIALAYNKLGLSCAALRHYDLALGEDPLNCDAYLGKGYY